MEKEVFKGKYFRVTVEELGPTRRYERVYQRHGVTVIPVTAEGKIRIVQKKDPGDTTPSIHPMSGYIEDGENPIDCAKKELAEELGLTAGKWESFATIPSCGALKKIQHFFVARDLEPTKTPVEQDPDENIVGTVDLSLDEMKSLILTGGMDHAGADNCFVLLKFVLSEQ